MRKVPIGLGLLCAVLVTTYESRECQAQVMDGGTIAGSLGGRLGVGASGFMTNTPAAQATYWLGDRFGVMVDFKLSHVNSDDASQGDITVFLLGGGVLLTLVQVDRVNLNAFASAAFGLADASGVALGAGLRPELFLARSFSVHTQVGVLVGIDYNPTSTGPVDATVIDVGASSLLGSAGFTFYF